MKITRDVIHDLLPAYLAGEASADSVALVDQFLLEDLELAREVAALRANPLPATPVELRPDREKETLNMTKRLLRWRGILMGLAIFFTLTPFSFVQSDRITWGFLRDAPPLATALVWTAALGCWGGFLYLRRRLQSTGL